VDFIVPFGAGGGADQLARTVAPLLEQHLGVSFPVLNVPGASGATGIAKLLAGAADGHAIMVYIADTNAVVATGTAAWKLDDLAPVARLMKVPSFLFVPQDSPYATFDEVEQAARARPDELKVATIGKNSVDETTLAFMATKGFKLTQVPFANPGERYGSILGGHADVLYEQAGDVGQFLASNQMRPLLIFDQTRLDTFPDVPTSREKGYEIFLPQFRGIVAKAGTLDSAVQALSEAFKKAYDAPEMQEFARTQYMARDSFQPAAEFKQFLEAETATLAQLMQELGLR
jgi:tripartite-type tricarboxylate transporter receptor subunit TctC